MNEVEKLYENASLSNVWVENYHNGYYEHKIHYNSYKEMINSMMKANDWTLIEAQEVAKRECRKEYPPFTAKKQVELIKWLCRTGHCLLRVVQYIDTNNWYMQTLENISSTTESFEESLASLINNLWQDLTEEDKQQIKEILE